MNEETASNTKRAQRNRYGPRGKHGAIDAVSR